jgi:hypothetical protein
LIPTRNTHTILSVNVSRIKKQKMIRILSLQNLKTSANLPNQELAKKLFSFINFQQPINTIFYFIFSNFVIFHSEHVIFFFNIQSLFPKGIFYFWQLKTYLFSSGHKIKNINAQKILFIFFVFELNYDIEPTLK